MKRDYAVKFQNVSKIYKVKRKNSQGKNENELFYALRDVSFEVNKGDIVGIFGTNGSGKSTAAKLLSGILAPDKGEVKIKGESALIAINSGLDNQLTGIENIELKAVLLGFDKQKIKEITEHIIEFSELGDFIYQPVKSYSSGMKSRLGFAISINIDADIIIIDEALSVGDTTFNEKCFRKILNLKEKGKTIFFVSHSFKELKKYCTKGLWIEAGEFKYYDDIDSVAEHYKNFILEYKKKTHAEKKQYRKSAYESRIEKAYCEHKAKNIDKSRVKKRDTLLTAIIAIILLVVTSVAYVGRNKAKEIPIEDNVEKESKEYNYIFVIDGKMNLVNGRYRDYIIENGKIVNDIVNISINEENKEIKVSKLPKDIQYYYEEKDVYDELDIIYPINSNKEKLNGFFEELTNNKITDLYEIDEDVLIKSLESIGCNLSFKDNKSIWNIDGKESSINRNLEEWNKEEAEVVYTNLNNKIKSVEEEQLNAFISQLVGENSTEFLEAIKLLRNDDYKINIIDTYKDYNIEATPLEDILKDYDKVNIDPSVINRNLIYNSKLVDLSKNIFVKKSKQSDVVIEANTSKGEGEGESDVNETGNESNKPVSPQPVKPTPPVVKPTPPPVEPTPPPVEPTPPPVEPTPPPVEPTPPPVEPTPPPVEPTPPPESTLPMVEPNVATNTINNNG